MKVLIMTKMMITTSHDYDKNQQVSIRRHFTVKEMKNIIEWIDQHPKYNFSSIQCRFQKVKSRNHFSRFRQ